MNITGTIIKAGQVDSTDQNDNQYQWVTIEAADGMTTTGRIGSKQGYQVGTPINVTVEVKQGRDNSTYNYFKRFNPQYGQPAPQRAAAPPQAAPQSPKPPKEVDWDAISRGKVRHGVVCAYIQSGVEPVLTTVEFWTDYIMSGKVLDPTGGNSPDAESEDDIPF